MRMLDNIKGKHVNVFTDGGLFLPAFVINFDDTGDQRWMLLRVDNGKERWYAVLPEYVFEIVDDKDAPVS